MCMKYNNFSSDETQRQQKTGLAAFIKEKGRPYRHRGSGITWPVRRSDILMATRKVLSFCVFASFQIKIIRNIRLYEKTGVKTARRQGVTGQPRGLGGPGLDDREVSRAALRPSRKRARARGRSAPLISCQMLEGIFSYYIQEPWGCAARQVPSWALPDRLKLS